MHQAVLGIAAARRQRADGVSHLPARCRRRRRLPPRRRPPDPAGRRRRAAAVEAAPLQHVGPVDAGRAHADQDLAGTGSRHVAAFRLEHKRAAGMGDRDGRHHGRESVRTLVHRLSPPICLEPPSYVFSANHRGEQADGNLRRRTQEAGARPRDRPGPFAAFGRRTAGRIAILAAEIERLEVELKAKDSTTPAAEALFRRT